MPVPKGFRESPGDIKSTSCDRRSFRVKVLSRNKRVVICCKAGSWDEKRQRCKVGTRAAKIQTRISGRSKKRKRSSSY